MIAPPLQRLTPVHELPRRLRFKLPRLEHPRLDTAYFAALLESREGVERVRINRGAGSVVVNYDGQTETREWVLERLAALTAEELSPLGLPAEEEVPDLGGLLVSLAMLAALPFTPPTLRPAISVTATWSTLWKGIKTLLTHGVKVEVLDAIAVAVATGRREYFTAGTTDILLKLGDYLGQQTARQSDHLVRSLLKPTPTLAWVERHGALVRVDTRAIQEGELVVVGPGEAVPIDGVVTNGAALVNEAALTGESVPVRREVGDAVLSGSALEDGRIKVRALRVGEETTMARISRIIAESLKARSTTQQLAEELANQRVYVTLGLGGATYLLTGDARRLAAVFLVDYACALKLGTPVAFKSGLYQAARHSVLFKGSQAMEDLARVDTLVFDKTGTLTHGLLEVTDVRPLPLAAWSEEKLLALVASLEEHATHPLALAVVRRAREEALAHVDHGDVEFMVAHGLSTLVDGQRILVGSRHYLEEHQGLCFDPYQDIIESYEAQGKSLLYIAAERTPIGLIALRDTLRPETPQVLEHLKALGVERLVMLTGDRRNKAEALAQQLGMDEVHAEMRPEDKANVIKALKAQGHVVAFVGDGVNDGPALVSADVGLSMPRGAMIARETADILLLEDRLEDLATARELAARTMDLIRDNFRLAAGINSAIVLGAALGWLSPVATSVLHNGTTIALLLNALSGVSLSRRTTDRLIDSLRTLKDAYSA
ncbi:MAG: heavy metal translocating P-type ATPase [Gammaproteobacteria bacterium]